MTLLACGCADPAAHVPPFARVPYTPFTRAQVVAIALTEWRGFGAPIDDGQQGGEDSTTANEAKPERQDGLWQRVGLYWWLGLDAGRTEARWTGKHDAAGRVFPPEDDGAFAWSAAFVSYVMRLAGAGARFPYAAAHHTYIDSAWRVAAGQTARWVVRAERPGAYAPLPGDLVCFSRTLAPLRYEDLPAGRFPAHCDIVVARDAGVLAVVGGNVDDAVTMKHVPTDADGHIADPRWPWFVVLRLLVP